MSIHANQDESIATKKTLSQEFIRQLKSQARTIEDHSRIGKRGLEPSVLKHIAELFTEHKLVKIRLEKSVSRAAPVIIEELCNTLKCQLIQQLGRVLILYRAA